MLMAMSLQSCAGHVFQDSYLCYHPIFVTASLFHNNFLYKSYPDMTTR